MTVSLTSGVLGSGPALTGEPVSESAEFDREGRRLGGTPGFLESGTVEAYLSGASQIDAGEALGAQQIAERWQRGDGLRVRMSDGSLRLLTSVGLSSGGLVLSSTRLAAPPDGESVAGPGIAGAMAEHSPLPIWVSEVSSGRLVFCNALAREVFGLGEAADLSAVTVDDLFAETEDTRRVLDGPETGGRPSAFLMKARTRSGREFWVSGASAIYEAGGERLVIAVIQDVTGLKEHESEIRHTRDLLSDALRSLSEAFALFDDDRRLVICNQSYHDLNAGISEFITPGVHWETLLRELARRGIPRHAVGREAAWVRDHIALCDEFRTFETEYADGTWLSTTIHPTSLGGFIVASTDITARKSAEKIAQSSEDMLSTILMASPANLCMSRIGDGEVIYSSPVSAELFGADASAKDQFADPLERADFLTELLPNGEVIDFAATAIGAGGRRFPALFSARIIEYRGEEVMVSTVTDLTEQHRARRELADANQRLKDAIEALDEGFALFDAEGRLQLWNQRYAELNEHLGHVIRKGLPREELLKASLESGKLDPVSYERVRQEFASGAPHRPHRVEYAHQSGQWFSVSRNPTSDGGYVITRLDITERKRAEQAEREADELMRRVLEACPVTLMMSRMADGELVFRTGEIGQQFGDRARLADYWADPEEFADAMRFIGRSAAIDDREVKFRDAEDRVIPALVSARRIEFRGEDMLVAHAFDLTERVAMEKELSRQQEMLFQSEKLSALGELLAGVAHELNNPLAVLVGHALMLEEEAADPVLKARTEKISVAAERCSRIVKTFLAMARQRPVRLENCDVAGVVETALDVAGYGLRSNGCAVGLEVERDLPPVSADEDQLIQVFANLLVNSEHVLKPLGTEAVFRVSARAERGQVVIDVEDNGPGIPEPIRARIFEPFFTTKGIGEGTGIGLAFCHRIIASHGGTIEAGASIELGGARFTVRLDAAEQPAEAEAAPRVGTGRRGRVLVIDDEPDVGEMIAQVLAADGFGVRRARSVREALVLLPGQFDVILSDLNMPDLDGRDLLVAIAERWPGLVKRTGFVTGDTMSKESAGFLEKSGRPYVEKPVVPADLRLLAARLMDQTTERGDE